ncbi:uncharacterized protein LOC112588151 [Harpegnathos saltator]|uniref:uncharacterized protein LOC112588151 n=1 Tax=Harpegnathos saltator TaxID=610380 RepID=UPI000DBEDE80|nr:uncharacterized protein LOC112588151 [Harpegnathos saltator]
MRRIRHQVRQDLLRGWQRKLANARYRRRTAEAVQPCLPDWVDRASGALTFRMTQVFTGHGCFGEYLQRIEKERTAQCHHCDHDHDSAQHMLQDCPAWAAGRGVVVRELGIGMDLSLPRVIPAILGKQNMGGGRKEEQKGSVTGHRLTLDRQGKDGVDQPPSRPPTPKTGIG